MVVRKCDRCGKCYDEYRENKKFRGRDVNAIAFVHRTRGGDYSGARYDARDLCSECLNAAIDFMNGGAKK